MDNNLPPNWSWVKLGDVCETTSGGTPSRKNPKYYEGKIPWVKSGELDKGLILDTEEKISEEALKKSSAKVFPKGTLLIALYGATIGKLAFLGVDAATNQAVCGIYKNEKIDSNFLFNFLFFKKPKLVKQSIGGAQPNISQGILKNLEIPLPPLPEQKKIVEKIEELFSGLDSGVASLKKAKEQIKLYRQSVLSSAFNGKLIGNGNIDEKTGLPKDWELLKFNDACLKIGDVDHKMPKSAENGKYPYLSTKDFTNDLKINFDRAKRISEYDFQQLSKKIKPEKGDIIFPRYGTIGKNVLVDVDIDFLVSYSCAIIKPNPEKITSKYLYLYTLSPMIKAEIKKYTVQTTQANVGIASINNFIVPLPSKETQIQIVEEIERRFSEADNLEKAIGESLTKAEALRQSILKQAFEGKLV